MSKKEGLEGLNRVPDFFFGTARVDRVHALAQLSPGIIMSREVSTVWLGEGVRLYGLPVPNPQLVPHAGDELPVVTVQCGGVVSFV